MFGRGICHFTISEPRGFITDCSKGRPFDGYFEWVPNATRPRMLTADVDDWQDVDNANVRLWSKSPNDIYTINTNNGEQFAFRHLDDKNGKNRVDPKLLGSQRSIAGTAIRYKDGRKFTVAGFQIPNQRCAR